MSECPVSDVINDKENEKGTKRESKLSTVNRTLSNEGSKQHIEDENNNKDEDDDDCDGDEKLDFCCLSGCLTILSVGILMFLALPAGILICAYASSNNETDVLIVGIILASSPVISFPLIALILYNRRRLTRLRNRKHSTSTGISKDEDSTSHKF